MDDTPTENRCKMEFRRRFPNSRQAMTGSRHRIYDARQTMTGEENAIMGLKNKVFLFPKGFPWQNGI